MTDSQPDRSQDFTSTEEEAYQRGRYNAFVEMSAMLERKMRKIVQSHPALAPGHEQYQSDQQVLDAPIASLGISNRALNILKRHRIHTIKNLVEHSETDLMKFKRMGKSTIDDIKTGLMRIGQTLRGA